MSEYKETLVEQTYPITTNVDELEALIKEVDVLLDKIRNFKIKASVSVISTDANTSISIIEEV